MEWLGLAWHCDSFFKYPNKRPLIIVIDAKSTWNWFYACTTLEKSSSALIIWPPVYWESLFWRIARSSSLYFCLFRFFLYYFKERKWTPKYWLRPFLTMTDIDCEIFTITHTHKTITFIISVSEIYNLLFFFFYQLFVLRFIKMMSQSVTLLYGIHAWGIRQYYEMNF